MKGVIIIYLIGIIVLFFLPIFLVTEYIVPQQEIEKRSTKIKLLQTKTNEIMTMDLNEYIMGVLVGEMPVTYEIEALKAQAVVARTYTLNKMMNSPNSHIDADMCDSIEHCQAYQTREYALSCWDDNVENEKWNKIKAAVLETENEIITYNGAPINAFFHAHSGGKTEDISNIWGRESIPYLKSVDSLENKQLIEKVTFSIQEIDTILQKNYSNYVTLFQEAERQESTESGDNLNVEDKIKILQKNSSGRVETIQISNLLLGGTEVRTLFGLRSTLIEIILEKNNVIFQTSGYGHGVGLSQEGANSMALQGNNYQEIIKHYYSGVEIKEIEV